VAADKQLLASSPIGKPNGAFFFVQTGDTKMYSSKLERLKRDSNELKNYMKRVEKEGNQELAYKLRKKYEYLSTRIDELKDIHTS